MSRTGTRRQPLSAELRELARQRVAMVTAYRTARRRLGPANGAVTSIDAFLANWELAHGWTCCPSTLNRWCTLYAQGGADALAFVPTGPRVGARRVSPEAVAFLRATLARPECPSVTEAMRLTRAEGRAHGWTIPSDTVLRGFVAQAGGPSRAAQVSPQGASEGSRLALVRPEPERASRAEEGASDEAPPAPGELSSEAVRYAAEARMYGARPLALTIERQDAEIARLDGALRAARKRQLRNLQELRTLRERRQR